MAQIDLPQPTPAEAQAPVEAFFVACDPIRMHRGAQGLWTITPDALDRVRQLHRQALEGDSKHMEEVR